MRAYSQDLRKRIVAAVEEGKAKAEVARRFSVGRTTVYAYLRQKGQEGHLQPKPKPGRPRKIAGARLEELKAQLEANNDATLEEHRRMYFEKTGDWLGLSTIKRALDRLDVTLKKRR